MSLIDLRLPRTTNLSLIVTADSGQPYSITTGKDNNGDQTTNDRPAGVPRNSATGPGSYDVDASFRKAFSLKKPEGAKDAATRQLAFDVSANNVLNHTQLYGYSGVITSPLFGKPINAAPGRRLTLGLNLSF